MTENSHVSSNLTKNLLLGLVEPYVSEPGANEIYQLTKLAPGEFNSEVLQIINWAKNRDDLNFAFGLWAQENTPIFKNVIETFENLHFIPANESLEEAQKVLDEWVVKETNGMIRKFPVSYEEGAAMLLAAVFSFEDKWVYSGRPIIDDYHTMESIEFAQQLPFEDIYIDEVSVVIDNRLCNGFKFQVLFGPGRWEDHREMIGNVSLGAISKNHLLKPVKRTKKGVVEIVTPVIELEQNFNLLEPASLGYESISKINEGLPGVFPGAYVSQAKQTTKILVNHEGLKAASVAAASLRLGAAMPMDYYDSWNIDLTSRPFRFRLVGANDMPGSFSKVFIEGTYSGGSSRNV